MTLIQAINYADQQRPNAYDAETKAQWLSELDGRIHKELFLTHEGLSATPFSGNYSLPADQNRVLLAPPPYDAIYLYWLYTRIDFVNGETARFNSSALMYNTAWINLASYINRTCTPRQDARLAGV